MKPVASELSGIAVEPDPTTVKGFASVTGTYLLGLAAFGVLRSSDGLARVIGFASVTGTYLFGFAVFGVL